MPRHAGQVRFGWASLKKPYRDRLAGRGITQRMWEDGADLRTARGHTDEVRRSAPKRSAPKQLTERLVSGEASARDIREIRQWSRTSRPAWIPAGIRDDVAAALSQLPAPQSWSSVTLYPVGDGQPWVMRVEFKGNRYPIEVLIPGGGEELSGAWQVLDLLSDPPGGRSWREWDVDKMLVDRTGS